MGFASFSVKRPVLVTVAALVVILIGVVSLFRLPMDLLPNMNPPIVAIVTVYPGASAQEMSDLVGKPLEVAASTTPGVKETRSIAQENLATVIVQFDWGTNMNEVREELRTRIDQVDLPDGAQKPILTKFDPSAAPIMQINVANGKDMADLTRMVNDTVVPRLELVDGVAEVSVLGGLDQQVQVNLDQAKLTRYGLSPTQVAGVIKASNVNAPLGTVEQNGQQLNVRLVDKEASLDDLQNLIVTMVPAVPTGTAGATGASGQGSGAGAGASGADAAALARMAAAGGTGAAQAGAGLPLTPVHLKDVATVTLANAEQSSLVRQNGETTVGITIQKGSSANTVSVANAIDTALDDLKKEHPELQFTKVSDSAEIIRSSVYDLGRDLLIGGFLAVAILFVFLRSLRTTLISAISIPVSIIGAFALLFMNGKGLNLMTLGGLTLAVGLVIDDSIVVIEAVHRHLDRGKAPADAARDGTAEVITAVVASTLTTVAVFLPIAFVPGLAGALFKELALTIAFALLASLVVSLTVVPMVASRLLRPRRRAEGEEGVDADVVPHSTVARGYRSILEWVLGHRAIVLLAATAVLAASVLLVTKVGTEFLPTTDEGQFQVEVKMPPGANISATDDKVRQMESILADDKDIDRFAVTIGAGEGSAAMLTGGGGGAGAGRAVFMVNVKQDTKKTTEEIMTDVRQDLEKVAAPAEVHTSIVSTLVQTAGGLSNGMQLNVSAPDQATLEQYLPKIDQAVKGVDGISGVEDNLSTHKAEIRVNVDRDKAIRAGLTPGQVAMAVNLGVKGASLGRLEQGEKSYDIYLALQPADRDSDTKLADLLVPGLGGRPVRLGDIATISRDQGPVTITRENRRVAAEVTGSIEGRDLGSVSGDVTKAVNDLKLPDTVKVSQSGMASLMDDGFTGLSQALVLAIILVFMVMAAEFESFLHPFVILLSLPLSITGVVVALWLSGYHFGVTAFMGLIMLVGIVVKNGIIMIDYINQLRAQGRDVRSAVLDGAAVRVRPVLMTALAAALGLVPLAIGIGGAGAKLESPLAIAVVGGLISSTLLTLVVVPSVYTLFTRGYAASVRKARLESRRVGRRAGAEAGGLTRSAGAAAVPGKAALAGTDAFEYTADSEAEEADAQGAADSVPAVALTRDEARILSALLRKLTGAEADDPSQSA